MQMNEVVALGESMIFHNLNFRKLILEMFCLLFDS